MLKRGRKREAKGLAVVYFIIGLIILLIILAVIWFALAKLDYSDKLGPDASMRPYVEMTASPQDAEPTAEPNDDIVPDEVDLTEGTEAPTAEPTEKPTEAPTPAPTAEPTPLPADKCAKPMDKMPQLPDNASENGAIGITQCYVSQPDDNKLMYVTGYGYVNQEAFDGAQARSWLIVTQVSTGQKIGYPLTLTQGVSGLPHSSAACHNASSSDFEIYLDVSSYPEGIYSLALVIGYVPEGASKPSYAYYPFSGDISFTVLNGSVITPITASDYE